jgi:hypothetical protein
MRSWISDHVQDVRGSPGGAPDCGFGAPPAALFGVASVARGAPVGDGRSTGLCRLLVGVFSTKGGLAPAGRCRAASLLSGSAAAPGGAAGAGFGCIGASTLPRMTGRPSLPLPMITILVLGDCAS